MSKEDILNQIIENNNLIIECIKNPNISRQEVTNYLLDYNQKYTEMINNITK